MKLKSIFHIPLLFWPVFRRCPVPVSARAFAVLTAAMIFLSPSENMPRWRHKRDTTRQVLLHFRFSLCGRFYTCLSVCILKRNRFVTTVYQYTCHNCGHCPSSRICR
jgi:hypothetical protein